MKNLPASVHRRLLNLARARNCPLFSQVVTELELFLSPVLSDHPLPGRWPPPGPWQEEL